MAPLANNGVVERPRANAKPKPSPGKPWESFADLLEAFGKLRFPGLPLDAKLSKRLLGTGVQGEKPTASLLQQAGAVAMARYFACLQAGRTLTPVELVRCLRDVCDASALTAERPGEADKARTAYAPFVDHSLAAWSLADGLRAELRGLALTACLREHRLRLGAAALGPKRIASITRRVCQFKPIHLV